MSLLLLFAGASDVIVVIIGNLGNVAFVKRSALTAFVEEGSPAAFVKRGKVAAFVTEDE